MLSKRDWRTIRFLFLRFLAPSWKTIIVIVVANVIIGFMFTVRPLVLAPAVDTFAEVRAEPAQGFEDLTLNNVGSTILAAFDVDYKDVMKIGMGIVVLFIVITVLIAALSLFAQFLLIRLQSKLIRDMTVAVHRHLLMLPLGYFYQHKAGDLVSRLRRDVTSTSGALDNIVRGFLTSLAQVVVSAFILFRTDALLAAIVIGLGSMHMAITRALKNKVKAGSKQMAQKAGAVNASLFESIIGIRVIKSFAVENYESEKVRRTVDIFRDAMIRFRMLRYYEVPLRMLVDAVVVGVVILIVFYAVKNGRFTLAGAAMFLYLSQQLSMPIGDLFGKFLGLHSLLGGAERVIEIFDTESSMKDGAHRVQDLRKDISVNHITFGYQKDRPVLCDVSLAVKRGEMLALVGPSGAGKSTLTDLILRLYDVDEGTITYEGVDIREFDQGDYRRKFGVVAQECLLFNGSVRENIVLNRVDDKENLAHAIWAANAKEFIKDLPYGLDTVVGDRGIKLSGGQRQRIAIARAIYNYPSILVLDEATSALDSESERAVQEAIDRVSKEMTTIVIAHRLSTIVHANKIVLLNQGRVEAIGPHATLLQVSTTYRRLYQLQFREITEQQEAI